MNGSGARGESKDVHMRSTISKHVTRDEVVDRRELADVRVEDTQEERNKEAQYQLNSNCPSRA